MTGSTLWAKHADSIIGNSKKSPNEARRKQHGLVLDRTSHLLHGVEELTVGAVGADTCLDNQVLTVRAKQSGCHHGRRSGRQTAANVEEVHRTGRQGAS